MNWWARLKLSFQTETPIYGCWIEPSGNIIECKSQLEHFYVVQEEFGFGSTTADYIVYDRALNAGWIRIAVKSVEFHIQPTPAQITAVLKWFRPVWQSDDFYVECPAYHGQCNYMQLREILAGRMTNIVNEQQENPLKR